MSLLTQIRFLMELCGAKLFNNYLNRPFRSFRTSLKFMSLTSTKCTNFVEAFIRDGDFKGFQLVRNWDKQAAPKRFGNVNVETHTSKLTFRMVKGNVIHFNELTNIRKKFFKGFLLPQLKGETGNLHPLINPLNGVREGVKKRLPSTQHKVEATNKPWSTLPDKINVLQISETKQNSPIPKVQIIYLPFDKPPILASLGLNNRQGDSLTPRFA